jgi:NTP pyrophosphatase (non-canonical NTP hydrolase)
MLDWKQYSEWVEGKIVMEGHDRFVENLLGLCGEAGEVAEKAKKKFRDQNRVTVEAIQLELGDVLFYVTAVANMYGSNLEEIARMNLKKLNDRAERGVIRGEGDNR